MNYGDKKSVEEKKKKKAERTQISRLIREGEFYLRNQQKRITPAYIHKIVIRNMRDLNNNKKENPRNEHC
jgi:hypothetical protein